MGRLLAAVQMVVELSQALIAELAIRTTVRQSQPPKLVSVTDQSTIHTDAAEERLARLVQTAKRNGTVYRTPGLAIIQRDGALPP